MSTVASALIPVVLTVVFISCMVWGGKKEDKISFRS